MSEQLAQEAIADAAGDVQVGRTVELLLDDDRVIVARVRQIQEGPLECLAEGCFRRFDSKRGRNTHIGKFHPELRERECVGCGEPFQPPKHHRKQKYCSQDCYHEDTTGRTTLVCEECGRTFEVKPSHADDRKHCSNECKWESLKGPREENTREEQTCPECGDTFETYPSRDQTFCSVACASESRWERRTCPMCGLDFEVRKNRDKEHCSRWCYYEARRADDRPESYYELVEEIAREFDDLDNVIGRTRAHLAPDLDRVDVRLLAVLVDDRTTDYEAAARRAHVQLEAEVSKADLEQRCLELVCDDPEMTDRVDPAGVRSALTAETLYEAGQLLGVDRSVAATLMDRLGTREQFTSPDAIVERLATDGGGINDG